MRSRSLTQDIETDVLIIGAGSAGCVLAGRLSADTQLDVKLTEAGQPSSYPWLDIPIGYFKTVGNPAFDWRFETEAEADMAQRRLPWPRGKGPGGTSLINGMLYLRGHQADYDQWAALGLPGWEWRQVLPVFQRAMHRAEAPGPADGVGGPLWVSNIPRDVLSDAFIEAAGQCGIAPVTDFNTGDNAGAAYFQMTTRRGRRMSAARAYLDPARHRPNLKLLCGLHAARVLIEQGRAVGAEFVQNGARRVIRARHQVIVCAGAIQSPQLLQLSGIGDPALLARHGIAVQVPLAGVGQNLQDHVQVRPSFRCQGVETLNDIANSHWRSAREFVRYAFTRTGALRNGVYRAGAFFKLAPDAAWPDVQIHFGLVSFDRPHQPPHPFPGITLSACLLRPHSRGSIEIASTDPLAAPLIRARYLSALADQRLAVAMVRKMRDIARAAPLASFISAAHEPAGEVESDADLLAWVRQRAGSIFHPVGTCAMGPDGDALAVLDHRFKVRGVAGLRVVDASAMPRIVSGNTNAPVMMMAERAAEWLRAELQA